MAYTRKLKSSKKKKKKKKSNKEKVVKEQTFADLPFDLLQLVMSRLQLKDNLRASAVCKSWHEACASVRSSSDNNNSSPWLIYFSETDGSYDLFDPSMKKTYHLVLPELSGFRVCYSKDGWLLMYHADTFDLVFFNPFTGGSIPVPSHWMSYTQRMAFSCAPTSSCCILMTIARVTSSRITIRTCRPNDTEWRTSVFLFRSPVHVTNRSFEQILFSDGVFYCLSSSGSLSIFDPSSKTLRILPGRTPKRPGSNGNFMTEHQGEIFLVYMYKHMNPTVHKLDRTSYEWAWRDTLGGLTIYASLLSSVMRAEQSGRRNCLCLSMLNGFKRECLYYKVEVPNETCLRWKNHGLYKNIWVMPPLNILHLLDLPLFNQLL